MEGMMGLIHVLTRQFISNNFTKDITKYKSSSKNNTLKVCFVHELVSVEKQQINKQNHQISFYYF